MLSTYDKAILKMLEELRAAAGWEVWQHKSSILFTMRANFGSSLDIKKAEKFYQKILDKELSEKEKNECKDEEKRIDYEKT